MVGQVSPSCRNTTRDIVAIPRGLVYMQLSTDDNPNIAVFCDMDSWNKQRRALGVQNSSNGGSFYYPQTNSLFFYAPSFQKAGSFDRTAALYAFASIKMGDAPAALLREKVEEMSKYLDETQ